MDSKYYIKQQRWGNRYNSENSVLVDNAWKNYKSNIPT
jgi:hypothetical protein